MSSRQKKPDARALFKQAKSRKGDNASSKSSGAGGSSKYHGKSKEEVGRISFANLPHEVGLLYIAVIMSSCDYELFGQSFTKPSQTLVK